MGPRNSFMNVDSLLAQATCAVLAGGETVDEVVGTAWLVTDSGHLLTAGHVVTKHEPVSQVWIRFPDTERPETATFVVPPVHDKARGLDFAILQLDAPTDRTPLPFTLVSSVEGDVRARGYGSNLPNAQSAGHGTLMGNYLREGSSPLFLFHYLSETLSYGGFSGAAVYCEAASAVIGLQIEAQGQSVFAMPLARIAEHWADLIGAATRPTQGLCVLLLPAADPNDSRRRVEEDIVKPVLDSLNLSLYSSVIGSTSREDLRQLERADVVIADVTHDDTNVTYELTVAQGLGTPDLALVQRGGRPSTRSLPFDVQEIDVDDVEGARRLIAQRLVSVRSIFEAVGDSGSNAVTDFFRAPLTQISTSNALALGYEVNFVRPVASSLLQMMAGSTLGQVLVDGVEVGTDALRDLTLSVVLPEHLDWADDGFIQRFLAVPGLVVEAQITHPSLSRTRHMKALPPVAGAPVRLLDPFPTTLSTMRESIDQRLGVTESQRHVPGWKELEAKEIDRFHSRLIQQIRRDPTNIGGFGVRDVCNVVSASTLFPSLP